MRRVLIVVDSEIQVNSQPGTRSGTTAQMVSALQQVILQHAGEEKGDRSSPFQQDRDRVQVVEAASLPDKIPSGEWVSSRDVFCPLTLHLPEALEFSGATLFQMCGDVGLLRQTVEALGYSTGSGKYWLPIVLTAKGPLYAEVIGEESGESSTTDRLARSPEFTRYVQPIHLSDMQRQSLYELGFQLLRSLQAMPSVYLIQFGFKEQDIWFDRLFPFPADPAISSLKVQHPDLFTCHWYCLTHQPLRELSISVQTTGRSLG